MASVTKTQKREEIELNLMLFARDAVTPSQSGRASDAKTIIYDHFL
jgi:hypothetical protein